MPAARTLGTLLIGVFTLIAFSFQVTACFAEHAGLLACHSEHHEGSAASDQSAAGESHCCHIHSSVFLAADSLALNDAQLPEAAYATGAWLAPEGPVAAIEHPPQLLS